MALKAQLSWFACVNGSPDLPPCVLLFGCFVKGSFNTQRGVKNLIGQFGVLHPLHPQCGCSSEKMCEQRTWTVCCFLLGPKPITLESIEPCVSEGWDSSRPQVSVEKAMWGSYLVSGFRDLAVSLFILGVQIPKSSCHVAFTPIKTHSCSSGLDRVLSREGWTESASLAPRNQGLQNVCW